MIDTSMKAELANLFVFYALEKLVEIGRITPDAVNGKWKVRIEKESLDAHSFGAGAKMAPDGGAIIIFHSNLTIEGLMFTASHESIHLAQICCGDMIIQGSKTIWKGEPHGSLPAHDPGYDKQPWEAEALNLQDLVFEHIKSKAPTA